MQCPDCTAALVKETKKKVELDRCPSCFGMWLDPGELNKLADKRKKMLEFNSVEYDSGIHGDKHPKRECPQCSKIMKKVDMLTGGNIIYDYCTSCKGFWLDKKELEDTKAYMKGKEVTPDISDEIALMTFALVEGDPQIY